MKPSVRHSVAFCSSLGPVALWVPSADEGRCAAGCSRSPQPPDSSSLASTGSQGLTATMSFSHHYSSDAREISYQLGQESGGLFFTLQLCDQGPGTLPFCTPISSSLKQGLIEPTP